jgi:hypothetical protein
MSQSLSLNNQNIDISSEIYMNENIRKKRDINDKSIKIINIKSYNDTKYLSFFMSNNKKMRINKCNGCYPIFQENQEGHIGEYGCLEDYTDMCIEIK